MDAAEISQVLHDEGLASDPAFRDLNFIMGTLPEKNVLGLYYPDPIPSIIALPPDADKSTLLHEVGHRYGHYYYGDISEEFAETFRKGHELHGRALFFAPVMEYFNCPDCNTRFKILGNEIRCPTCLVGYRRVG